VVVDMAALGIDRRWPSDRILAIAEGMDGMQFRPVTCMQFLKGENTEYLGTLAAWQHGDTARSSTRKPIVTCIPCKRAYSTVSCVALRDVPAIVVCKGVPWGGCAWADTWDADITPG
jgi:hypothetical protein